MLSCAVLCFAGCKQYVLPTASPHVCRPVCAPVAVAQSAGTVLG